MKYLLKAVLLCVLIVGVSSCKEQNNNEIKQAKEGVITDKAMVVSAHHLASKIGSIVMEKGGNAYDAMIATSFALAVVHPSAGNIGGGGFMIYRNNDGTNGSLDFREKAPLKAHAHMYLEDGKADGEVVKNLSLIGALSTGVPGTVEGAFAVHKKFGTMDMKDLIQPAIDLCIEGYEISKEEAIYLNKGQKKLDVLNGENHAYSSPNGEWEKGDIVKNMALGKTLTLIRDNGSDGFYKGETADLIVKTMKEHKGIISHEDLEKYKSVWREAITFDYKDYKVISMAPSSSGGICLAQMMGMTELYPIGTYGFQSTKAIQLMVETERRAYADRSKHLGDPDFVEIPTAKLMNKEYLKRNMANFSFEKANTSEEIRPFEEQYTKESNETTHFSIIDSFGNAVSVTTTLNLGFGSRVIVDGAGFILNNEMDDFSSKPGVPNVFGVVGGTANAIQPEKRMLSSMTPTIVEKKGKLFMVVGTPGGSTIITSVYQTILNVIEFGMTMQEAVDAPRFHHQWKPDSIKFERDMDIDKVTEKELNKLGYPSIKRGNSIIMGQVDAILVKENGKLEAGADRRNYNSAAGF